MQKYYGNKNFPVHLVLHQILHNSVKTLLPAGSSYFKDVDFSDSLNSQILTC